MPLLLDSYANEVTSTIKPITATHAPVWFEKKDVDHRDKPGDDER